MSTIRIAGVVRESITDGPGLRFTVFTQGCPHHCPGCHNPETHDPCGGKPVEHETILAEIDKNPLLAGVTLSGGDPVCQAAALLPLARAIKERGLSLWMYTGYTFEQLMEQDENVKALTALCDCVVDGPFLLAQRSLELRFRGSSNQRLIDVARTLKEGRVVTME